MVTAANLDNRAKTFLRGKGAPMQTERVNIRAQRRRRIKRFAAAQEKSRSFVPVSQLAEYRAQEANMTFGFKEDRLHSAYIEFAVAILRGEFEGTGKSEILCLSEEMPPMRLIADFLAGCRIYKGDHFVISTYLVPGITID
jgi:hypothetical protein